MTNHGINLPVEKKKFCLFLGTEAHCKIPLLLWKKLSKNNKELHNSEKWVMLTKSNRFFIKKSLKTFKLILSSQDDVNVLIKVYDLISRSQLYTASTMIFLKCKSRTSLGSVVKTLLPKQGMLVGSLVRELSPMPPYITLI